MMPPAVDRREFLCVAGNLAFGASITGSGSARATSPPPPVPGGTALKTIAGDGIDPLPAGAKGRLGSPRMRVPGHVNALQFSPRGNTLVAASGSEIRAWDPSTGKILFRLGYPERASISGGRLTSVDSFALLVQPDAGGKHEIRHYSFGNGKLLSESPPLELGQVQHCAFSLDGAMMAVIRQEALYLYDGKGTVKWHEALPPAAAGGICFLPDGASIAVTTKKEVKLFSTATGKINSVLNLEPKKASEVVGADQDSGHIGEPIVSARGKWLAATVGDEQDLVCCWDVRTTKHHQFTSAKPIGFSPDESELLMFKDGTVTAWTLATGAAARTFDVPNDDLVLSPDGKILASGAGDAVVLMDASTGKRLAYSAEPPGLPSTLHFDRNGRLLGLLSEWGGWVEWEMDSGISHLIRPADVSGLTPVALSGDGRSALYRKKAEYSVREVATGKTLVTKSEAAGMNDMLLAGAMTPDGRTIVSPTEDGLVVTDAAGRKLLRRTGESEGLITSVATSGHGRWAAVAYRSSDQNHRVELYDLLAGKFHRRLTADGQVSHLTFSPDGDHLAVAGDSESRGQSGENQRTAAVYVPESGRLLVRITQSAYQDAVIALSAGGRMLARLEGDEESQLKVAIWDVVGNAVRARFPIGRSVSAVAFSPDSRTLAVSMHGGPVFFWDLHAPPKSATPPTIVELDHAWLDLRATDGARSFEAIKLLARNPGLAVPFLRDKVSPVTPPDAKQVDRLIRDLDHKDYRRRETAMRSLAEQGERVREPLKQALTPGPTPEVRERIERLLVAEERPTPDYLRRIRAVEAMEVAGTKEAGELLAHWAGGAPGASFTRDAEAAAKRLAVRAVR